MSKNDTTMRPKGMWCPVFFHDGNVRCDMCPFLETYARKQCRRTGEYIADTRGTGYECPLMELTEEGYEQWVSRF